MNKSDLVNVVSNTHSIKKKVAEAIVNTICETITDIVANGDEVRINDFGAFKARKRPQKNVRNPATGEEMTIPERHIPVFTAFKNFKETVRNSLN